MIAVGILTLRRLGTGLSGTLYISPETGWVVGEIDGDAVRLTGTSIAGDLRRDGGRRVGELTYLGYPFVLDGAWDEDEDGRVLRCVVGELA